MNREKALQSYKNRTRPAFKEEPTHYSFSQNSYLDFLLKKHSIAVSQRVFQLSGGQKSKLINLLKNKRLKEVRQLIKERNVELEESMKGEWIHIPQRKKVPGIRLGIARPNRKASTGKRQVKHIQKKRY